MKLTKPTLIGLPPEVYTAVYRVIGSLPHDHVAKPGMPHVGRIMQALDECKPVPGHEGEELEGAEANGRTSHTVGRVTVKEPKR